MLSQIRTVAQLETEMRSLVAQIQGDEHLIATLPRQLETRRLQLGRLLVEARKAFPKAGTKAAGWGELLHRLGLPQSTAWRYMEIAGHVETGRKEAEAAGLSCTENERPPTYAEVGIDSRPRGLEGITGNDPGLSAPLVSPTDRKRILELAAGFKTEEREASRAQRVERVADQARASALSPDGARYPVIMADPPWRYVDEEGRGSAEDHYATMSLEEICAMPVAARATDDAVIFLWATAPLLPEAFEVLRAWGFEYRTSSVWDKERIGIGHWFRVQHEHLLVGVRGNFPTPPPAARPSSVIRARRGEHSSKPDEAYAIVEAMWPGLPRLELFARRERAGWNVWGAEAHDDEQASA
jgi:N6-adenosine-specific RNA methylase IME4